ncbi:MAG: hypothetical protein ABI600_16395 [Luteolibacter sp.]
MKVSWFLHLAVALGFVCTECKADPWPKDIDGQPLVLSTVDYHKKTVDQLVTIFMTHHDETEQVCKTQKEVDDWHKRHPGANPPVILHMEQSYTATELMRRGSKAKAAIPAMIQTLETPNATGKDWAIRVLSAVGDGSPTVVQALVRVLHKDDIGYEASMALINLSVNNTDVLPAVIAKLASDLDSPNAKYSTGVLEGIGADSRAAVPVLIQLLEHNNTCGQVVNILCSLGADAAPAVPALLQHYDQLKGDESFAQRRWVVITFGKIGPGAKDAVPLLLKAMRTSRPLDAAHALWRIDPQYTELAVQTARGELYRDNRIHWNSAAVAILGEIGSSAKSTVPLLLQALEPSPYNARSFNIAWTLWRIDPEQKAKVITVFEDLRLHPGYFPYQELPLDAVGALWQIQPERRDELRPAIVAGLRNNEMRVGWAEMKTLQPALTEISSDPRYSDLHTAAVLALRQINRARADEWTR